MPKKILWVLVVLVVSLGFACANRKVSKAMPEGPPPESFKTLKEKITDPKTGLPKTLDPDLFKGEAKKAYQTAREIPEVLVQMPYFCGCEVFGHENLLDCFIDDHGAG